MEMASENQVTIVGNLTDDPELRYTPNGAAVVKFRVAVNRRFKDESGNWKDGETSYFSVNAWRSLAENCAETLTRGHARGAVGPAADALLGDPGGRQAHGGRDRGRRGRPEPALGDREGRAPGSFGGSSDWRPRRSALPMADEETPLDAT